MDLSTLTSTLISVGATWLFAWLYYKRAGDELQREAALQRRIANALGRGLHNGGIIDGIFDADGNLIGLSIKAAASLTARATLTAVAEVTPGEPKRPE
jgi:hypothetical protein